MKNIATSQCDGPSIPCTYQATCTKFFAFLIEREAGTWE